MTIISSFKHYSAFGMLVATLASAPAPVWAEQMHYATPEEAAQALIDAAVNEDVKALEAVLGPDVSELASGDPVADAADREAFVEAALTAAGIEDGEDGEGTAILVVGEDDWPFAIPLVKDDQGWRFDMDAGRDEIYKRRIGRNELHAIAVMRAIVDAENEYQSVDRDGDGILEYAQHVASSEGQKDGLYWPVKEGEPESPIGPLVAEATAQGYEKSEDGSAVPYYGYIFRMLAGQGENAAGGAMAYEQDGDASRGYAVLAYPAEYGNSGIMTFMVDAQGIVFEKDLGDQTVEAAAAIAAYDPDMSWDPVTD